MVDCNLWVQILYFFLSILGTIISAAIIPFIALLLKKWKIDVKSSDERMLQGSIDRGVSFTEQLARNHLRKHGVRLSGSAKMDMAIDFVLEEIDRIGLKKIAGDKIKALIESKLDSVYDLHQERKDGNGKIPEEDQVQ